MDLAILVRNGTDGDLTMVIFQPRPPGDPGLPEAGGNIGTLPQYYQGCLFAQLVPPVGIELEEGDVLLLYGANDMLEEISSWLGTMPLAASATTPTKIETARRA